MADPCLYLFRIADVPDPGVGHEHRVRQYLPITGTFSATIAEVAALSAAYVAPCASLSLALFKIRVQYGLRPFAELSIGAFVLASCLNLFVTDFHSALVVRFVSGMAAAPLSSLGFSLHSGSLPGPEKTDGGAQHRVDWNAAGGTGGKDHLSRAHGYRRLSHALYHGAWAGADGIAANLSSAINRTTPHQGHRAAGCLHLPAIGSWAGFFCRVLHLGALLLVVRSTVAWCSAGGQHRKSDAFRHDRTAPRQPLLDLRWIFSWPNLHLAAVLIVFRAVTAEQSSTMVGFLQQLGIQNDQMGMLFGLILLASIAGGIVCAVLMSRQYLGTAHVIALAMIAIGAFMDSQSTNLSRPSNSISVSH